MLGVIVHTLYCTTERLECIHVPHDKREIIQYITDRIAEHMLVSFHQWFEQIAGSTFKCALMHAMKGIWMHLQQLGMTNEVLDSF